MSTDKGGPRAMKAPLREVKCWTRSLRSRFFLFLHAYTTSDLRTFRRTCVHVRKECSLEISVEFFYEIFTEDASLPLLYRSAKKSKMTKNSNQGGGG